MPAQPSETAATLLRHLGFEATVKEVSMDDGLVLEVQTEDEERLIGREGQTLSDLQYLINRILFQEDPTAPKVMVDVGGYRSKARAALLAKVEIAAAKVRKWGELVELEPLTAYDRRIVHHALKDDPGIETQSVEVEGTAKKVILLRPKAPPVK